MPAPGSSNVYQYKQGLGHVGSYQVSSQPWVTGNVSVPRQSQGAMKLAWPQISRFIIVKNTLSSSATSVPMRVGFSSGGVAITDNYFTLDNGESFSGDFKCSEVYIMSNNESDASASVLVGMTGIEVTSLGQTWNNWSGSAGIG